ncbi:class I SAM-dependent methyltransferase [Deinococcus sp.]|uniref:class I SAM-dependent methyltransferase n=1 Tax=Deinococcus sp. TaxID=47478 RepID=UPI0025E4C9E9|nr:class I SAM-dependent methyltransferase [Deinococcus sp.]
MSLCAEAAYFTALCRPHPGEHWLDVGTSAGFYAGVLARAGAQVTACDISPAMLREAARREPHPNIYYALLNAERSGLPGESFSGVTIGATTGETASPQAMLAEAARLLIPGGQLWIMAQARDGSGAQALLTRFGGLSFADEAQLTAWLPGLRRTDFWRRGNIVFGRWIKS